MLADYEGELPVELVDGIGPTFGSRLRENGIEELSQLVERSPDELAEITSTERVSVSPERTATWLEEANERLRALERRDEGGGESDDESGGTTPASTGNEATEATEEEQ
ncbi:hypothetical protein ACFQJD_15930 [Haloplanus sp. GCM10025708]|uniref:hypothetical protein n=1 Tax=Haloplanus sp. GCM10025708 TaxID=3252679 RepID=UPI0036141EE0